LPQHKKYIRKVNFKVYYQLQIEKNWIQYQEPVPFNENNLPLYPIYNKRNIELFDQYLIEACRSEKVIPVGRLGLYKYMEMSQAISLAMNMIPLIETWKEISPKKRYFKIRNLLNNN
ncbi:MAG: UDP-galactopyranose mutase, partial [Promethearchaeota archaeon]